MQTVEIDFEGEQPSSNCEFIISVDDGESVLRRFTSVGETVTFEVHRLPTEIYVGERFRPPQISRPGWLAQQVR